MSLDVARIKADFPILKRQVHGKRLVYLDSAATSQKPLAVLDAMDRYYREYNANVHRGVYTIAEEATAAFEAARAKVAGFVNAHRAAEIVYVRNATEAINLVAYSWARANLREGDPIVLTHMEHHANIVPWQILAAERGVEIRWIPLTADYRLDLTDLDQLLDGAKLLAFSAMSNVLGTINEVRPLADAAHAAGAHVLVDACQAVPHLPVDVQAWDADFVAFSAHKMCGPTGIGALWARTELLEAMPPFMGGGEMITQVTVDGFTPNEVPWKFEAGTPPIAEAVGFGAAVDYVTGLGMDAVREHEMAPHRLHARRARQALRRQPHDLRPARHRGPRRCDLVPLRGHPRPRHLPGGRRRGGVRAGRPSLCQAAHARARSPRHDPGVVLRLQRRSRRRRPHRRARPRREVLRLLGQSTRA